mmetsp:Transcript_39493/g.104396  ORF Transcript_39493/g.104396 Transcript_39493/m.104396 type:complete len:442 (+) Transcript_39493:347-1672(+)
MPRVQARHDGAGLERLLRRVHVARGDHQDAHVSVSRRGHAGRRPREHRLPVGPGLSAVILRSAELVHVQLAHAVGAHQLVEVGHQGVPAFGGAVNEALRAAERNVLDQAGLGINLQDAGVNVEQRQAQLTLVVQCHDVLMLQPVVDEHLLVCRTNILVLHVPVEVVPDPLHHVRHLVHGAHEEAGVQVLIVRLNPLQAESTRDLGPEAGVRQHLAGAAVLVPRAVLSSAAPQGVLRVEVRVERLGHSLGILTSVVGVEDDRRVLLLGDLVVGLHESLQAAAAPHDVGAVQEHHQLLRRSLRPQAIAQAREILQLQLHLVPIGLPRPVRSEGHDASAGASREVVHLLGERRRAKGVDREEGHSGRGFGPRAGPAARGLGAQELHGAESAPRVAPVLGGGAAVVDGERIAQASVARLRGPRGGDAQREKQNRGPRRHFGRHGV